MKKISAMGCWLLAGLSAAQGPMGNLPGSLFNETAERGLVQRRTAMRKGDVLTIVVNEVTKGQFTASTTTNRTEASNVNAVSVPVLDVFAGPVLGSVLGSGVSKIAKNLLKGGNTGATETSSGGGTAINTGNLNATLSVVVTDVDANGNLHIQGARDVRMNKEIQHLVLTGIVRQDDVLPDNTVASSKIANADIQADGKGAIAQKTRRSVIGKILDWLF